MTIKAARITEYKGVVYRSKSEAMFARFLELENAEDVCGNDGPLFTGGLNYGVGGFVYEPEDLSVDGWRPDFLRWATWQRTIHGVRLPVTEYALIEYKPSRPTQTYAEEFALRCQIILERFNAPKQWFFGRRCECLIYWGSVFNADRGRVIAEDLTVEFDADYDWLANFQNEVKSTRFDLCATSSM